MYIMKKAIKIELVPAIEYQALSDEGNTVARMIMVDGTYDGYSMVPEIKKAIGEEEGLLFLLNWMVSRVKSPLVSKLRSKLLHDYGFVYSRGQLVWEPHEKISLESYEVWVEGKYDSRSYRLEIKARSEDDARFVVNLHYPRVDIGYIKKIAI
jgi:hypothetical protein